MKDILNFSKTFEKRAESGCVHPYATAKDFAFRVRPQKFQKKSAKSQRYVYLCMCRIYRYQVEGFFCYTQTLAAMLQTALYVDFLYYYFVSVKEGKPVRYELPV